MENTINKLNTLKDIKPDKGWKLRQKEILMNQISNSATENKQSSNILIYVKEVFLYDVSVLSQPIASVAIIVLLIISGGFFSISAASEATPGSFLYTAKIVGERTQFLFTPSTEEKFKLQVKFVERRAEEITGLAYGEEHQIEKIADNLKDEILAVQERLAQIEEDNPATALELAKDIENKTNILRQQLKNSRQALTVRSGATETKINEAIRSVDATGLSALNTIVRAGNNDENQDDLNKRVATKLESTREKISEVEDNADKVFSAGLGRSNDGIEVYEQTKDKADAKQETAKNTAQATKVIDEAEKFLEDNDYESAIEKINESEDIISKAVETVDENKKEQLKEDISTSTPAIKGVMEIADDEEENIASSTSN